MEDIRCPTNLLPSPPPIHLLSSPPPIYLLPPPHIICPKVSVVIPMYNAEEFITECLDSLLIQTLQDFEVIVADDCSTDNSVKIVESYVEKFGGRLKLKQTEKNSGGGDYVPRNIGLELARGEYVIFLDSDDFLLGSALETLYNAAKEYDADVVYSSIYYDVVNPNDVYLHRDGLGRKWFREGIKDKTDFTADDRHKIFQEFVTPGSGEGNFRHPWSKFVRRDLLIKNDIRFPDIVTGGDCIWCINVYAYAKRFLRLPIPLYFYRRYNGSSITRTTREPSEQVSYWVSALSAFIKALNALTNKTEFLRDNPYYCYEAVRGGHFKWCLNRTDEARKILSNKEIYEALYREFGKRDDLSDFTMPMLFSIIDSDEKERKVDLQTINNLKKEINQIKKSSMPSPSSVPIISIIIPMYNAEKYIGECLESILNQTFRDFEVIVVDDCSTDNSVSIVQSYAPKFNGRLTLAHLEENSGSGAMPRNKGVSLSRGEYIKFVDSDDTLTKTALEELYTLAKDYDADVVYCERYFMSTGVGEEFIKNIHLADEKIQKPPFVHKPEFEPDDLSERVKNILDRRFWFVPWDKFVRRNLLVENEIFFPHVAMGEDKIWSYGVIFYAKKILRVPNMVYIRRVNDDSIMGSEKTPQQTINFWLSPVLLGLKSLDNLMSKHEFFKANPQQRYAVLRSLALTALNLGFSKAEKLSSTEVYETIKQKFGKHLGEYDVLIPALCSLICEKNKALADNRNAKKLIEEKDAEINRLKEELSLISYQKLTAQPAPSAEPLSFRPITCPISVIVSLYNYEKYIGECLDSILTQTFQDFEVIVVDDCSTDNSVEVVKSYLPKFDGRLKLIQLETNSGGGGLPRNKGFELAGGEYVFFMDADDVFIKTALEEMYTLAKEYDADVVYCEKYYMSTGVGEEFIKNIYLADERIQKPPFVDKPTLETEDFVERVNGAVMRRYWVTAWLRLVQRKLLVENNIRFDSLIGSNDFNWTFKVLFCSKRFLRVPNICYIRRIHDESVSFRKRTPAGYVRKWMDRSIRSLKDMDNFLSKIEFFRDNPQYRNDILDHLLKSDLDNTFKECQNLSRFEVYDIFRRSFCGYLGDHDILFASLCAHIYDPGDWWGEKYTQRKKGVSTGVVDKLMPYVTARIDIQQMFAGGDLQILSVSDNKADVQKPVWMQRNGIGYKIQSQAGKIEFVAKTMANGRIHLYLRGLEVPDPKDKSKRIPYWIDYTKLTVNGKTILNTPTPVWCFKPVIHNIDAKAGEEFQIEAEWLPHRNELIADKFKPYITARIDIQLMSTEGDFQILSVSDYFANVTRPAWFQRGGIGYQIQSTIGMLEIVAKADVEGQVQLQLKGPDIRDRKDNSKRIPYWIDYTKLTVNGKTIFDKLTPTWHDKAYFYRMNAKADEEIKIKLEWLPHRSDN